MTTGTIISPPTTDYREHQIARFTANLLEMAAALRGDPGALRMSFPAAVRWTRAGILTYWQLSPFSQAQVRAWLVDYRDACQAEPERLLDSQQATLALTLIELRP